MNILILTTIMHYFAIRPFIIKNQINNKYDNYILTIIISTTLSILWHINKEPYGILLYLDYLGAIVWFYYDLYLANNTKNLFVFIQILFFNLIIFLLNIISLYTSDYIISHSFWHILSAIKCYFVSDLLVSHLI